MGVQRWEKFMRLYGEVGFSLASGDGYSQFPWVQGRGLSKQMEGAQIREPLRWECWSRYASRSVRLNAGVFPETLRVPGGVPTVHSIHGEPSWLWLQGLSWFCTWNKTAETRHLSLLRWAELTISPLHRVYIPEVHFLIRGDLRKTEESENISPGETALQIVAKFPGFLRGIPGSVAYHWWFGGNNLQIFLRMFTSFLFLGGTMAAEQSRFPVIIPSSSPLLWFFSV